MAFGFDEQIQHHQKIDFDYQMQIKRKIDHICGLKIKREKGGKARWEALTMFEYARVRNKN